MNTTANIFTFIYITFVQNNSIKLDLKRDKLKMINLLVYIFFLIRKQLHDKQCDQCTAAQWTARVQDRVKLLRNSTVLRLQLNYENSQDRKKENKVTLVPKRD